MRKSTTEGLLRQGAYLAREKERQAALPPEQRASAAQLSARAKALDDADRLNDHGIALSEE